MARKPVLRALLPAGVLLASLVSAPFATRPASAAEIMQHLPVWLPPPDGTAAQPGPAVLNLPPGWVAGDAAVVLAAGGDWPPGQRERLVAALLGAGAAVLELNLPRPGAGAEERAQADLVLALATLRGTTGAGLVVAIGHGAGGEAALRAGTEAADAAGWRYAAVAWLGPGEPRFLRHDAPEAEAWTVRAPLLCDILAMVQEPAASPLAVACRAALSR